MKLQQHLQNHQVHAWQTGAQYTDKGQRIAAVLLPDQKVYFFDIDRQISGVTSLQMNRMYMNVKEFVTHMYMHCHYNSGPYDIKGFTHEEIMELRDLLIKKAEECK